MNPFSFLSSHTVLYWSLMVAYSITVISIVGVVLSENRNPVKSLAWVTVLLLFPIGGVILYVFFGRSIKNKRMISRRNRRRLRSQELAAEPSATPEMLSTSELQQIDLAKSLTGAVYHQGNEATIFQSGTEKFESLLNDIASAQKYINFQYYIMEDDVIGTRVSEALIERARAGVTIRIIYDHIGCFGVKESFFQRMSDAGIQVYPFFRVAFPPFATRINWRNHRKIVVIDGKVGYIGGMNVADRYIDGGKKFDKWRDTHMRIKGPAVAALQYSFAVDWSFMGQPLIEDDLDMTPSPAPEAASMQMLTSGPTSEWSNIAFEMLKAIGHAKKRIYIQTPYFLPTESILRSLQAAALARVDVRVMIPKRSDSLLLTYASYSYINECLRAGVKIYLYEGGMLHSKTMIVDDDFSSIGSANIDFRSFEHNFESTMFIYSRDINRQLRHQFMSDQAESSRVNPAVWRSRPMSQKAKESVVRLLSPIL